MSPAVKNKEEIILPIYSYIHVHVYNVIDCMVSKLGTKKHRFVNFKEILQWHYVKLERDWEITEGQEHKHTALVKSVSSSFSRLGTL